MARLFWPKIEFRYDGDAFCILHPPSWNPNAPVSAESAVAVVRHSLRANLTGPSANDIRASAIPVQARVKGPESPNVH
jgi:hypothetical protein